MKKLKFTWERFKNREFIVRITSIDSCNIFAALCKQNGLSMGYWKNSADPLLSHKGEILENTDCKEYLKNSTNRPKERHFSEVFIIASNTSDDTVIISSYNVSNLPIIEFDDIYTVDNILHLSRDKASEILATLLDKAKNSNDEIERLMLTRFINNTMKENERRLETANIVNNSSCSVIIEDKPILSYVTDENMYVTETITI